MDIGKCIKRSLDLLVATIAVLILLPLWLLVGFGIWLEDPGPIFFKQKRLGKHGNLFTLLKFRSMYLNDIPPLTLGAIKHAHPLVTKVGYLIRRFKIDETPQFINVLRGEMSLVGPRPCLPDRLTTMSKRERERLYLSPGLTGWAEVNGNVELTWEEQVALDYWYVKNWTLLLDLHIILKTIKVVLLGSQKNASALACAKALLSHAED